MGSGGGVALYMPNCTEYKLHLDLSLVFHDAHAAVCVIVEISLTLQPSLSRKELVICEIYQPPNKPIGSFFKVLLDVFLNNVSFGGLTVHIMGDISVSLLGFPNATASVDLLSLFLTYSFVPLVNRPTRVTPNCI